MICDHVPEDNKIWNDEDWPKFAIADGRPCLSLFQDYDHNDDGNVYVIHLHKPRFVGKIYHAEDGSVGIEPNFIDDPGSGEQSIAKLMRESGLFYRNCV